MNCSECGSAVIESHNFCANCGECLDPKLSKRKKSRRAWVSVWLMISGVMLVGHTAAVYIPAMVGQWETSDPGAQVIGAFLWPTLFFFLLWKRLDKPGAWGFLFGLVFGGLVYLGASVLASYMQAATQAG